MYTSCETSPPLHLTDGTALRFIPLKHHIQRSSGFAVVKQPMPFIAIDKAATITIEPDTSALFVRKFNEDRVKRGIKNYRLKQDALMPVQLKSHERVLAMVSTRDLVNAIGYEIIENNTAPELVDFVKKIQKWRYEIEAPITLVMGTV